MSISDCLEINPLCPLVKYTQPYLSHRSRKLFLASVPIIWLRAQPSAALIALLMSWEQSGRGIRGLSASQRRPSPSRRSEPSAFSSKSITKQCWSIWFSYCFHLYLRLNHSVWWHRVRPFPPYYTCCYYKVTDLKCHQAHPSISGWGMIPTNISTGLSCKGASKLWSRLLGRKARDPWRETSSWSAHSSFPETPHAMALSCASLLFIFFPPRIL